MINISKKAENYLNNLLSSNSKKRNLRISIRYPGTEYAECKIVYNKNNNIKNTDFEIKYPNFSIYLDNFIIPYLKNAKIDLFSNNLENQLMLMAPYAKKKIEHKVHDDQNLFLKLEEFIRDNINPMLYSHGGKIILVDITKSNYILIKFLGGCNGCSMVGVTLKKGIEKEILNHFPKLKGVRDITEHNRGNHSFF